MPECHENVQVPLHDSARHSASETPTLHEESVGREPLDVSLNEKRPEDPNPEAEPDKPPHHSLESQDVYIVDWDGPDDPENPRK